MVVKFQMFNFILCKRGGYKENFHIWSPQFCLWCDLFTPSLPLSWQTKVTCSLDHPFGGCLENPFHSIYEIRIWESPKVIITFIPDRRNSLSSRPSFPERFLLPPLPFFSRTLPTQTGEQEKRERHWMTGWSERARKVVNDPSRQMMAERERRRRDPFLLLFSHTISNCATTPWRCCTEGSSLLGEFPNTILCILSKRELYLLVHYCIPCASSWMDCHR